MKLYILISSNGDEILCNPFTSKLKAICEWERWTGIDVADFECFDDAIFHHLEMVSEPDEVVHFVERETM